MDHRITQCPRCGTSFRVTEAHLAVAAGAVRCGSCLHIFNAREHWAEDPASQPASAPEPTAASEEPNLDDLIIDDDALFDDNTPLFADEREPREPLLGTAHPARIGEPLFNEVDFSTIDDAFGNSFNDTSKKMAGIDTTGTFDHAGNSGDRNAIGGRDAADGDNLLIDDSPEQLTSDFNDLGDWEQDSSVRFGRVQDLDEELSASDEEWTRDLLRDDEPLFATADATTSGSATADAPAPAIDSDQAPALEDYGLVAAEPAGTRREPTFGDFNSSEPAATPSSDELRFLDDDPLLAASPAPEFDDPTTTSEVRDADEIDLNPEFLDTPPAHRASESDLAPEPAPAAIEAADSAPDEPDTIVTDASYTLAAPPAPAADPHPLASLDRLAAEPLQIHRFKHEPRWPRVLWSLALVALLLLLAGQYVYKNFETLARSPARPWLAQACGLAGCTLPPQVDASLIRSGNLIVRSHPTRPGALVVDAILTNLATFPQPYPQLQLQFSDLNGAPVAGRRFVPTEYLAGELTGAAVMPVQQPVHIALELVDPGPQAVNYALTVVSPPAAR